MPKRQKMKDFHPRNQNALSLLKKIWSFVLHSCVHPSSSEINGSTSSLRSKWRILFRSVKFRNSRIFPCHLQKFLHKCRGACRRREKQRFKLQILLGSNFQVNLERCLTNFPLRQRLLSVSCFINKQKEFLEFLSSYFRCLAGSAKKDCASSVERTLRAIRGKQKNGKINFQITKGNEMRLMKWK